MSVQYAKPPVLVRLALSGDGHACRAALAHETARLAGQPVLLVVDLDAAEEVDSLLLSSLVLALKRLEHDGGGLELACSRRDVRALLGATGLDRVLALSE
jgi:anti-anti-sigma regulatory factor